MQWRCQPGTEPRRTTGTSPAYETLGIAIAGSATMCRTPSEDTAMARITGRGMASRRSSVRSVSFTTSRLAQITGSTICPNRQGCRRHRLLFAAPWDCRRMAYQPHDCRISVRLGFEPPAELARNAVGDRTQHYLKPVFSTRSSPRAPSPRSAASSMQSG